MRRHAIVHMYVCTVCMCVCVLLIEQSGATRRGSCFLSTNRLNSSAEGILKSALFPSQAQAQSGDSGDLKAQHKARKHSSVRSGHTYIHTYILVHSSPFHLHACIHTVHLQQSGHRSHSRGSSSSSSEPHTYMDGREKMSPPNFKVTSASLQINDQLIATDHEFVLSEEDSERLNAKAGQVAPTVNGCPLIVCVTVSIRSVQNRLRWRSASTGETAYIHTYMTYIHAKHT